MVAYLGFEVRRLLRIRALLGLSTLLPLTFYLVFTLSGGDEMSELHRGIPIAGVAMIMVAGVGTLIGVLSHSSGIAFERADGWLRQLRATPLPPSRVVAVRGVVSILTVLPPLVAVSVAAVLLHGVSLPPGRWVLVVSVMWLGAAPFALLGLALGYTLSRELVGPATTVAWVALAALGGLFVPVESFPAWLRPVSYATPSYRYAELGWQAMGGTGSLVAGGIIVAAWTVLFGFLAVWAYRRSSAIR